MSTDDLQQVDANKSNDVTVFLVMTLASNWKYVSAILGQLQDAYYLATDDVR